MVRFVKKIQRIFNFLGGGGPNLSKIDEKVLLWKSTLSFQGEKIFLQKLLRRMPEPWEWQSELSRGLYCSTSIPELRVRDNLPWLHIIPRVKRLGEKRGRWCGEFYWEIEILTIYKEEGRLSSSSVTSSFIKFSRVSTYSPGKLLTSGCNFKSPICFQSIVGF